MSSRLRVGLISLVLVVSGFVLAISSANAYTSPGAANGYVNDFADVLTPEQELRLSEELHQHRLATTNEVAIVTVSSTAEESIETYAVKLFEEWGIGRDEEDNGVLLLLAIQDRKLRIEVGYGLESVLTDARSAAIIRDATPFLRDGDYDTAIRQMTGEMLVALGMGETELVSASAPSSGPRSIEVYIAIGAVLMLLLFFVTPIFFIALTTRRRPGLGGGSAGNSGGSWSSSDSSSSWSSSSSDSSSSSSSDSFSGGDSGGGGASGSW